jgi:hypothetical protein
MNIRHTIVCAVGAGALLGSSLASATTVYNWQGTVQDWIDNGSITDGPPPPANGNVVIGPGDGDTTFTYVANSFPTNSDVTIQENEFGGVDLYDVGFGFNLSGPQSSGSFTYKISTTDPTGLSQVALDTVVAGATGDVTKELFDADPTGGGVTPFLTLTSIDGTRDPASDYASFGARQAFWVVDTINGGAVQDIHNEATVPEPGSVFLIGIGLVGLGFGQRRLMGRG